MFLFKKVFFLAMVLTLLSAQSVYANNDNDIESGVTIEVAWDDVVDEEALNNGETVEIDFGDGVTVTIGKVPESLIEPASYYDNSTYSLQKGVSTLIARNFPTSPVNVNVENNINNPDYIDVTVKTSSSSNYILTGLKTGYYVSFPINMPVWYEVYVRPWQDGRYKILTYEAVYSG